MKVGIQQRLVFAVISSLLVAALGITSALYLHNRSRSYRDNVRQSAQMVEAATLAFSQAVAADDEVLLDALLHELKSRPELHVQEAYVLNPAGLVIGHSVADEYGKTYPVPSLLREEYRAHLSEVAPISENAFRVLSLLQDRGQPIGLLVATFSADHVAALVRSEMLWIVGVSVPVLLLSAIGVLMYGGRLTSRLKVLQTRALAVGAGQLGEAVEVKGADEITQLTVAFNKMLCDLAELRQKDRSSAAEIETLNGKLSAQLKRVEELKEQLAQENAALRQELRSTHNFGDIIGFNGGLRHLADEIKQLTSLPVTVLITGESGTGKELVARYLHEAGVRRDGPLITVNCAALPLPLVESELFGHEKGSFTGALSLKKGKFELAHKGTLFLDEVGELPAEAQAKLLRTLQQAEIVRVGGDRPISVDVRLVAATNRDLKEEVKRGKFREDLYYRLKVVELTCPPLRERLEDLPSLAQHFIEQYRRKLGKEVVGVSPSALKLLSAYHWPGNVRELENMIARAIALAKTQVLGPADFGLLQSESRQSTGVGASAALDFTQLSVQQLDGKGLETFLESCERCLLKHALEIYKTQREAAEALNLTQTKLHRLLKKHRLGRGGNGSEISEMKFFQK